MGLDLLPSPSNVPAVNRSSMQGAAHQRPCSCFTSRRGAAEPLWMILVAPELALHPEALPSSVNRYKIARRAA